MCDVSNDEDIAGTFAQLKERYGKLHALVHSVAYAPPRNWKVTSSIPAVKGFASRTTSVCTR